MSKTIRTWAILALLLAAFAVKGVLLVPPPVDPSTEFNAPRAVERLARILGDERPHPVDTPANDAVRERIVGELAALGLEPMVRGADNCNGLPGSRTISCSRARNVVAIIGPEKPGPALLLNAHYDSTPAGPGAADDGIGVATLLEVAAVLRQRPLARPVILLFNEGEEYGLNGASVFAENDPLAGRIDSLINVEARGVSGPAVMFETDEPNAAAIADYASAARRPVANSLTADFAKLIPNYTDVVVFKGRRWRTLSYAIIGNETRYHSPGDTVAALDRRSVQHMGSEVLAAARTIGTHAPATSRSAYTDIAGRLFLHLPLLVSAALLVLLLVASAALAWKRKALGRPLGAVVAAFVGGVGAAWLAAFVAGFVQDGDFWRAYPIVTFGAVYASLLAAMTALVGWIGGKCDRDALRAACWMLILAAGGMLSLAVPGSTIFFLIAPAVALAGLMVPAIRTPLMWIAALVQLLMFGQILASIEVLLVDGPLWAVAPLAALAALPFLVEVADTPLRLPAAVLLFGAVGLWIAAFSVPRSSAERPLAFTIDYVRDDRSDESRWAIASKQAPLPAAFETIGRWTKGVLPYSGRTRWLTGAPEIEVPQARVAKIAEERRGNGRLVTLRLDRGGADSLAIRIDGKVAVDAMGLAGRMRDIPASPVREPAILRCSGRACDGLTVQVAFPSAGPAEAALIATRSGLPEPGRRLQALRPGDAHPQYGADSSIRITGLAL